MRLATILLNGIYFALNLYNRAVRLLTSKHPPSVIYKDNKAYTPLHFAVISGHTEWVVYRIATHVRYGSFVYVMVTRALATTTWLDDRINVQVIGDSSTVASDITSCYLYSSFTTAILIYTPV